MIYRLLKKFFNLDFWYKKLIPAELFKILKDDAVKVLHSVCSKMGNSAVATGLEKVSFHSSVKERQAKECSNYCTVVLIHMVAR